MKRSRRLLAILLVFLFAAAAMTACQADTDTQATQPASTDKTSSPSQTSEARQTAAPVGYVYTGSAPISDEPVTISVLTTNGASLVYDFDNMTWQQQKLRLAGVTLDMEMIDAPSYNDVVKTRLAAGTDLPDLIFLAGKDDDMAYINAGLFQDLTALYDQYGYNLNRRFADNPVLKAELTTPDGKIYYAPLMYLTVDWCRVLMVNKPWLDQLDIDIPDTTDALYDMLKAIRDAGDLNGNGAADEVPLFMRAGYTQVMGTLWGLDLVVGFKAGDDGVVECSYASPHYKEFLSYCHRLYEEGLLYSEFATANYDTQTSLFSNNQIGCILHFNSNCTGYSQTIDPDWNMDSDEPIMQPIIPPAGPYGDQWYYGRDGLGNFFGISRDCEDPETVFCFIDYLYSDEAAELSWYGLEGTDYTIDNGQRVFSDAYLTNADNYRMNSGYNFEGLPAIQIPGSYAAIQCDAIVAANETIRQYARNPIGFSFTLDSERDIIQTYSADLKTYFAEMFTGFISGSSSLDGFDSYLEKLDSMHVDEITAVYQAIYDRQQASMN